jgi:2-polyprenyl-3-methyl-5-hydroxy-6-metoxy-1,4-benzoquinol methylase
MPRSHPETKPWIIEKINSVQVETILDVGAGVGTYSNLLADAGWSGNITALEVWEPYIEGYSLREKYDSVINLDVRDNADYNYDLVIFGDILEHISKEDAIKVWEKTAHQAKYAVIAIPTIHYPQGELEHNPHEEHIKDDWSVKEVLETFSDIVDYWNGEETGAFWAEFKIK